MIFVWLLFFTCLVTLFPGKTEAADKVVLLNDHEPSPVVDPPKNVGKEKGGRSHRRQRHHHHREADDEPKKKRKKREPDDCTNLTSSELRELGSLKYPECGYEPGTFKDSDENEVTRRVSRKTYKCSEPDRSVEEFYMLKTICSEKIGENKAKKTIKRSFYNEDKEKFYWKPEKKPEDGGGSEDGGVKKETAKLKGSATIDNGDSDD